MLKRILNLGAENEKVGQLPVIKMLKEDNVRQGFLEREDFQRLHYALPFAIQPLVKFAYHTGWRKGEVLALTWDKVNLKQGTVRLEATETKNSSARNLVLNSELKGLFRKLWNTRDSIDPKGHVFTRKGQPIKDFRGAWKKACKEVGLEGTLFHDLRRSGVRNNVRAGISEKVAMAISGHKTRAVFDRYNIVDDRDLAEAARLQDASMENVTSKESSKETKIEPSGDKLKLLK